MGRPELPARRARPSAGAECRPGIGAPQGEAGRREEHDVRKRSGPPGELAEGRKPGSVTGRCRTPRGDHLSRTTGHPVPLAAYPELDRGGPPLAPYLALLPVGFVVPSLSPAARWALTPPFHPCLCGRSAVIGGLLSVTLSVALRRPGVTRHRALRSPDFPRAAPSRHARDRPAISRPSVDSATTGGSGWFPHRAAASRAAAASSAPTAPPAVLSQATRGA